MTTPHDLGEHLWTFGRHVEMLCLAPVYPRAVAQVGQDREVTFVTEPDDESGLLGTVRTSQPLAELRRICASTETPILVRGRLSPAVEHDVVGNPYRVVLGEVAELGDSGPEPTRIGCCAPMCRRAGSSRELPRRAGARSQARTATRGRGPSAERLPRKPIGASKGAARKN